MPLDLVLLAEFLMKLATEGFNFSSAKSPIVSVRLLKIVFLADVARYLIAPLIPESNNLLSLNPKKSLVKLSNSFLTCAWTPGKA